MSLNLLPETRQNTFTYCGKVYKAFATFAFTGNWASAFCHSYKDNITTDTPPGYNYDEFRKLAHEHHAIAEIYQCGGRLLVPYSSFIAEYREIPHHLNE